jgi:hypothetical protein
MRFSGARRISESQRSGDDKRPAGRYTLDMNSNAWHGAPW